MMQNQERILDESTAEFIERFGLRFEADRMPRIAGRMLAYLLLSPEARSLDEAEEALQISKTSASTNARLLERAGVVERVSRPGDRRDFYRIVEDLHTRMLAQRVAQLNDKCDLLEQGRATAAAQDQRVGDRLALFSSFFADMAVTMEAARLRWVEEKNKAKEGHGG